MKKMFIALALAAASFAATVDTGLVLKPTPAQVKSAHEVGNKICPVSGDEIGGKMGPGKTVIYKGQAVQLCCPMCLKKFAKDPDKFLAIAQASVKNGKHDMKDTGMMKDTSAMKGMKDMPGM